MPPTTTSKNLGTVAAIWTGSTPPSNKFMMWIDNSTNPYKRKFWDTVTLQWLEVAFIAAQSGQLKRFNPRVGGTTVLTLVDDVYIMNVEGGAQVLTLPVPDTTMKGFTYIVSNYSSGLHTFTQSIRVNNTDTVTTQPAYTTWQITVVEYTTGVFQWCLLSSSIL